MRERANSLVANHWNEIETLAVELDQHGTLQGIVARRLYTKPALINRWLCLNGAAPVGYLARSIRAGAGRGATRRLRFSAEAVRRYANGRRAVLDEYLVDVLELAMRAQQVGVPKAQLAQLLRATAQTAATESGWWWGCGRKRTRKILEVAEDMAVAAEAQNLMVAASASPSVAAALGSILTIDLDG